MQHAASQTSWLNVDGMRLYCLTAGENGSPVILLHGAGVDSATLSWGEIIGPLAEHHRLFALDLPGYGHSSRPAKKYTIDFYVAVVKQILDILDLDKICAE